MEILLKEIALLCFFFFLFFLKLNIFRINFAISHNKLAMTEKKRLFLRDNIFVHDYHNNSLNCHSKVKVKCFRRTFQSPSPPIALPPPPPPPEI